MAKLSNKKQKKSPFYEEKSLVGLTPGMLEHAIVSRNSLAVPPNTKIS
jgi:hypothetical protein